MAYPHLTKFHQIGYALESIKNNINKASPFLNFQNVEVVVIFDGFAKQTKNLQLDENEFSKTQIKNRVYIEYKAKLDVFNKKREDTLKMKDENIFPAPIYIFEDREEKKEGKLKVT